MMTLFLLKQKINLQMM